MSGVLLKAVSAGRPRQVRLLLDSGINLETVDDCGQTPLIRAIFIDHARNREKIVRMLLRYGAKTEGTDVVGRTALSWACLYGRDKEVALLLESSVVHMDLNQGDLNGQTALFHAATSGSAATVKLMVDVLKRYDLSVEVANFHGLTPLMQAMRLGHDVCASILMAIGGAVAIEEEIAEKWATRCHPDIYPTPHVEPKQKKSQFPPILSQVTAQKIKYRENRAGQLQVQTPRDSDEDSTYGSEVSYYANESFDLLPDDSNTVEEVSTGQTDKVSIRSITSSTEVNIDSSGDDDRAVHVGEKMNKGGCDLPQLFALYEQQQSQAYRPPAARPTRGSPASETSRQQRDVPTPRTQTTDPQSSNTETSLAETKTQVTRQRSFRRAELQRTLVKRTLSLRRGGQPGEPTEPRYPAPLHTDNSSSSDAEDLLQRCLADLLTPRRAESLVLPRIGGRKAMVESQEDDNIGDKPREGMSAIVKSEGGIDNSKNKESVKDVQGSNNYSQI